MAIEKVFATGKIPEDMELSLEFVDHQVLTSAVMRPLRKGVGKNEHALNLSGQINPLASEQNTRVGVFSLRRRRNR